VALSVVSSVLQTHSAFESAAVSVFRTTSQNLFCLIH